MLKRKFITGLALAATLFAGIETSVLAIAAKKKRTATFKVRIENISAADGIAGQDGQKYPFALSPGLFYVNHKRSYFFDEGKKANPALEAQAEDGSPDLFSKKLLTKVGSVYMGVFNVPAGGSAPGPILAGGVYEFTFTASEGMRFNLISMYGQSNDLFYSPKGALDLFDADGNPLTGDITDRLLLWDAGTEKNQAPGFGDEQAPRQKMANTGAAENGVVSLVKDGYNYPGVKDVLQVTIEAQ
jgi:hypothetical protein